MTDAEFMVEKIEEQLLGGKITNAVIDQELGAFGFTVEFTKKSKKPSIMVWVDQDAEQNGPGWLAISEMGDD